MLETTPKKVALGLFVSLGLLAALSAAAAPPVIASSEGETPGRRVEVTELKRTSGGTLSLKFTFINDSDKPMGFGYDYGDKNHEHKDHASVGGVTLVDPVGKKKYFVVRDSDNECLCSRGLKDLAPRSRVNLWAKYPAPPESVKKITIEIPHFSPLDDAPIGQ